MSKRLLFTLALAVGAASSLAAANSVTLWNTLAEKAFAPTQGAPDYPSTHALVGTAAAETPIDLFGDRIRFETTSLTLPGVSRSFRGFPDAAEENGDSRIFAGIHFPHAVRDGKQQGRSAGKAVAKLLQPVGKAPDNY